MADNPYARSTGSSNPYSGSSGGAVGISSTSKKKKGKKKERPGSGGFLGTGIGPSLTDLWNETERSVEGVAEDFAGIGVMAGQTLSDTVWAARKTIEGDDEMAQQYMDRAVNTTGQAAVGMGTSLIGTAADVADLVPDVAGVDLGEGIRDLGEKGVELAARAAAGGDEKYRKAAKEIARDLRPQSFGDRAEQRGYLSPLLEDIGNVAMAGGATRLGADFAGAAKTGRLSDAMKAPKLGPDKVDLYGSAQAAGGKIAKAGRVGEELAHPIRGAYTRTGRQLTKAASDRTLRRAAEVDPLLQEYRASQGLEPLDEGVVQKARPLDPKRQAQMADEYENRPGIDSETNNITPEDQAAVTARTTEEARIAQWLEENGHVTFEYVDAADNPYYLDSMGQNWSPEGMSQFDIRKHQEAVARDINENQHMYIDNTGSFGEKISPGVTPEQNNIRRAVHDFLGHRRLGEADFSQPGENLAYGNESAWFSDEARRSVGFDQQGLTAYMAEHGQFPGEQRVGALPAKMSDPEFLAGPAPWARRVAEQLNPEGMVSRVLNKAEGFSKVNETRALKVRLNRLLGAERNRMLHDPSVTTSVEAARYLVENFDVSVSQANEIVGSHMRSALDGTDEYLTAKVAEDPTLLPWLEEAGWNSKKLPDDVRAKMTDEEQLQYEQLVATSVDNWKGTLDQRYQTLVEGRLGTKGLEAVGETAPTMTKAQLRQVKKAEGMRTEADRLRARAFKNAEGEIAGLDAEVVRHAKVRAAAIEKGQIAGDEALAAAQAKVIGLKGQRWDKAKQFMYDLVMQGRGFSYNAVDGSFLRAAFDADEATPQGVISRAGEGHSVALLPKTVVRVPLAEFADAGPELLDMTGKGMADILANHDYTLGGWVDEAEDGTPMVHIDISQNRIDGHPISREEASLLALARDQISYVDLASGEEAFPNPVGSPKIARQLLASSDKGINSRLKVARNLYKDALAVDGEGNRLYPGLEVADIDALLGELDYTAWVAHTANPEKYPTVADVYTDLDFQFRQQAPKGRQAGTLQQTILGRQVDMKLWEDATAAINDWKEKAAPWYFAARDFINRHYGEKVVTLANGRQVPADVFLTDAIAILSVSASPTENLKNALTAYDNLDDFVKDGDVALKRAQELTDAMLEMDPKKRTSAQLFTELTKNTHMYTQPKKALFDLMNGRLLDEMDTAYFQEYQQEGWGAGPKPSTMPKELVDDAYDIYLAEEVDAPVSRKSFAKDKDLARHYAEQVDGYETTMMEHAGSKFFAKIRSFKDNLIDPENSTSVTNDSWMARLFGMRDTDWNSPGKYREYADKIRNLADEISAQEGRRVRPHEVQAVLWAYAKQEIGYLDAGVLRAQMHDVIKQIDRGTWSPDRDAILGDLANEEGRLGRAKSRVAHNESRTKLRNSLIPKEYMNEVGDKVWADVPKKVQDEIMAKVTAKLGEKGAGAYLPETDKVAVKRGDDAPVTLEERTQYIHRPLKDNLDNPEKMSQGQWLAKRRDSYEAVVSEVQAHLAAGDTAAAKSAVQGWAQKRIGKMQANAEEWGSFDTAAQGRGDGMVAALERHGVDPTEYMQRWNRDVRGSFTPKEHKLLTRYFKSADPTTLTHEDGHLIRHLLGPENTTRLERALGMKAGEKWSVGREEQFANLFTAYMASDMAPAQFLPLMKRLKSTLSVGYEQFNRRYNAGRIDPELQGLFDEWFSDADVPDILDEVPVLRKSQSGRRARVESLALEPGTNRPIIETDSPDLRNQTPRQAYGTGRQVERAKAKASIAASRAKNAEAASAKAGAARDALVKLLNEEKLPDALRADILDGRAHQVLDRVADQLDNASTPNWPAEYRHIGAVFDNLRAQAKANPALADILEDASLNLKDVLDKAKELGFDARHIRDFSDAEVSRIMHDTARIGDQGTGRAGREQGAGTRKASRGTRAKKGTAAHSIEALAAAVQETMIEKYNDEFVTQIEQRIATPWKPQTEVPKGFVRWDPKGVDGENSGAAFIIPKEVDTYLRRMNQDFNHGIFRAIGRVTTPWRGLVLTLSPRWYVNNVVSNAILTTLEGVRLKDWRSAWNAYRNKEDSYQSVSRQSFVSDVGERSIVPTGSVREAIKTGDGFRQKFTGARRQAGHRLRRVNEVVDEIARTAVFERTLRKTGDREQALMRAHDAMVDYSNLSPFEQQVVRTVVPFYSWQKGILKIVTRMPVDHPIAVGLSMQLGGLQNQLTEDRFGGELPFGYSSLVQLGDSGALNTRGYNPFMDSTSLVTPEGIANSINPFVDIALRHALGAPEGGFVEQRKLSSYGTAMPTTSIPEDLGELGAGIPLTQVGMAGAGEGHFPISQQGLKFAGLNYMTEDDIKKIIDRTRAAREQIKTGAPFPAQKRKKKSKSVAPL